MISSSESRVLPSCGFERFSWYFMRVSGAVLMFLALGHLVVMHLINSINVVNYEFVARRYATPFWRSYDGLMLVLALFHGFNGLRVVVNDYLKGSKRLAVLSVAGVLLLSLLIVGLYIVFAFQP